MGTALALQIGARALMDLYTVGFFRPIMMAPACMLFRQDSKGKCPNHRMCAHASRKKKTSAVEAEVAAYHDPPWSGP